MSDAVGQAEPVDQPDPSAPQRRGHRPAPTGARRSRAGLRPTSPRPARGPSGSPRARSRAGLACRAVPTTIWTLPALDDTLSAPIQSTDSPSDVVLPQRIHRVLTAFGHPADTLIRTSPAVGDPIDAGVACDANGDDPVRVRSPRRHEDARASEGRPLTDLPVPVDPGHRLVVLDLGCRGLDDRSAAAVAGDVAPGGTLAVLTHSHRDSGRLIDTSGAVIAALQDADLLYLQHIVIVEHPLSPRPEPAKQAVPYGTADDTTDDPTRGPGRGLVDLTLFVRPGSPPPSGLENGAAA
jgi:hypothetical protein